ncbi:MAG: LysR family transcriptional regulator [Azospirillaceae bacterium]|nr:LysR family transcriptional regulator [Azospirillaceae bacterium]
MGALSLRAMQYPDLNLLIALDLLLEEGSVAGAARRLHLSAPAMSRTLARIRETVGDPILVRAGRRLVPTPRALELRERVRTMVAEATGLLRAEGEPEFSRLDRTFTIRGNDFYASAHGGLLLKTLQARAPNVKLRFAPEGEGDDAALREGRVDLLIASNPPSGPEMRVQTLATEGFVGVARPDHPIFGDGGHGDGEDITAARFAAYPRISISRRGLFHTPVDQALSAMGLTSHVALVTGSLYTALAALSQSDLLLPLPDMMLPSMKRLGLAVRIFPIPLPLAAVVVRQSWHPRFDNDPAHRWLRQTTRAIALGQIEG